MFSKISRDWQVVFNIICLICAQLSLCVRGEPEPQLDVVFTWVNGSDPAWRREYSVHTKSKRIEKLRYLNTAEIYLAIAGVQHMAPWVRKIHVLTMKGQQFNTNIFTEELRRKINFVDHAVIIPAQYLPTFNSHGIELFLHNIPGITDTFLYMNDDFFLVCPLTREAVFDAQGRPKGWVKDFDPRTIKTAWGNYSLGNTNAVIEERHGVLPMWFWHGGYLLNKHTYQEAWANFTAVMETTARNRVRKCAPLSKGGDITTPLFLTSLALITGRQVKDTTFWYYIWYGRIPANDAIMRTSWQNRCVNGKAGKPVLFVNVQDMTKAKKHEVQAWCLKCVREYSSAFRAEAARCLCLDMTARNHMGQC